MGDTTELIGKGLETVDDIHYSKGEQEADRTARHLADMQSDNWLSKSIRPMITIWAIVINSFLWIGQTLGLDVNESVMGAANGILIAIIGFYFVSRGAEKVFSRRSAASIQIEKMRTRHELKEERKENRRARKQ